MFSFGGAGWLQLNKCVTYLICLCFAAPLLFILWLPKHSAVPDELKAPKVVRGAFGESLTVPCRYQPKFRNSTKYWCRGPIYELCKIVAKTPKQRNHDRCSIADDKEAGVFIVTMRALRPSDRDMYWCVVARPGRNIFTGVKISLSNKGTPARQESYMLTTYRDFFKDLP